MSNASLQVDAEGVVRLAGVIDFDSAGSVRDGLQQAAAGGQGPLVMDMSGVTQANSVGLSLILRAAEHCRQQGRELRLRSVPDGLQSIARVCGLDAWLSDVERARDN